MTDTNPTADTEDEPEVRTPPPSESDPTLAHVNETIDDAKESAAKILGDRDRDSDSDRDRDRDPDSDSNSNSNSNSNEVDPTLGEDAPVP